MITWKGVSQPFFIGGNGIKVNVVSIMKHLCDDLIPAAEAMDRNKDFAFVQDISITSRQSSANLPEAENEVQICEER